ncbi:MAG: LytTR family DNA-binding domain-containing protein [Calditrichaceae bacterium]
MFIKIKRFLDQPYPADYDFEKLVKVSAACGLFVSLFLIIFDPFGKEQSVVPIIDMVLTLGYGLVTFFVIFIVGTILLYFYPDIFNEENWKVKNEIVASILILIIIGLANATYTAITSFQSFSIGLFVEFQMYTFLVGIFPTIFFIIMEQHWLLKKNFKEAQQINAKLQKNHTTFQNNSRSEESILLTSDNEKEELRIEPANLLFVKSVGNYIEVYFKNSDKIDSKIMRSSLKRIEDLIINHKYIFRSHRAYLVNLNNISNVTGNSQGYQLELEGTEKNVPVSRKYLKNIRDLILQ